MVPVDMQGVIDFISSWRLNNSIGPTDTLTTTQEEQFAHDLNMKINSMSFDPPVEGTSEVFYSGELNDGVSDTDAWKVAKSVSESDGTKYFYVSDTEPGALINTNTNADLRTAIKSVLNNSDTLTQQLMDGTADTRYSFGDNLSLDDHISQQLASRASGDVFTITPNTSGTSVWARTELPTLLDNPNVTLINGIAKGDLIQLRDVASTPEDGLRAVTDYISQKSATDLASIDVYKASNGDIVAVDTSKITGDSFTPPTDEGITKVTGAELNGQLTDPALLDKYSFGDTYGQINDADPVRGAQALGDLRAYDSVLTSETTLADKYPALSDLAAQMRSERYRQIRGITYKGLGAVGVVLIAYDGFNTAMAAKEVYDSGDHVAAIKMVDDWAIETGTGFATSILFLEAAAPFAAAMSAIPVVGIPAALITEFVAGTAGFLIGSELGKGLEGLFEGLMTFASAIPNRIDPLVIDLNGDGIQTSSKDSGVFYDLDSNGLAEQTGWVDGNDGILAIDKNSDGIIEGGDEIFGDHTILSDGSTAPDGFTALASFDSNHDGKVDATDANFSSLLVWQDANQDGASSTSELKTLTQAGIQSISLQKASVGTTDANGNVLAATGTVTMTDSSTVAINEYNLDRDPDTTKMTNWVDVSSEITALPNINAMGDAFSLQQAMARDTTGTLQGLVEDFVAATDPASRAALIDSILFNWTGSAGIDPASRGPNIDARKLAVIEKLSGTLFDNSPTSQPVIPAPALKEAYNTIAESMYARLTYQADYKSLINGFGYTWDYATNTISVNAGAVTSYLDAQLASDVTSGEVTLGEVTRILRDSSMVSDADYQTLRNHFVGENSAYAEIIDTTPMTTLRGDTNGNTINVVSYDMDTVMSGGAGDDTLNGDTGNDILYGDTGNDTLNGGTGNDYMDGGTGNDTYVFGRGYGTDTVHDVDATTGNTDTVRFAGDITPEDINTRRVSNDLYLEIIGTSDKLIVKDYFTDSTYLGLGFGYSYDGLNSHKIEQFIFADGTTWDDAAIASKAQTIVGTSGGDTVNGFSDQSNYLYGLDGNDTLNAGGMGDQLYGGTGDDTLNGGNGNDLLDGGTGTDTMKGGQGNDTYVFGLGYGTDTIYDNDATTGNLDTVAFQTGIDPASVTVTRVGDDLRFAVASGEVLTVQKYFTDYTYLGIGFGYAYDGVDAHKIEQFTFADGTVWNGATIASKVGVITGTTGNDSISGFSSQSNTIYGLAGDDTLHAAGLGDQLHGGVGNDTLVGGNGTDLLDGGTGNDTLTGGTGNDIYTYNLGDGSDTVYDKDGTTGNVDTLSFGVDVNPTAVTLKRNGSTDDLEIRFTGSSDVLTVQDYFTDYTYLGLGFGYAFDGVDSHKIEQFTFADGTVWNVSDVMNQVSQITGTGSAETINGFETNDTITALGGDDTINAGAGNDTVDGGTGNDTIHLGDGNDTAHGGDGNDIILGEGGVNLLYGDAGSDILTAGSLGDQLYGGDGVDTLNGGTGNDALYGGADNDALDGGAGNDVLDGGAGNDTLTGGTGNDTYVFARGYGNDTIVDTDSTSGNVDVVNFAADIAPSDIVVGRIGNNLVLSVNGTTDSITVQSYFASDTYKVEQFHFTDGTVWNAAYIMGLTVTLNGTASNNTISGFSDQHSAIYGLDGDDTLNAGSLGDQLYGGNGNDTLNGGVGNDQLYGGAGTDSLTGGTGNDLLDGGAGNDTLTGGAGNDTYVFGLGYGNDTVYDSDSTTGNVDVVQFLAGISPTGVTVTRNNNDLVLSVNGTTDKLTVQSFFSSNTYKVEQFTFSDGTVWGVSDVSQFAQTVNGTSGNDTITGNSSQQNYIFGLAGNDTLNASSNGDYLYGGDGTDTLNGGTGNDQLYGGNDNDTVNGGAGNDLLDGGAGNDQLGGGTGNDTYAFGLGYGQDTVLASNSNSTDVVNVLSGVNPADITLSRGGAAGSSTQYDVVLSINGTSDKLTIQSYFSSSTGYTPLIQFSNGTTWDTTYVKSAVKTLTGTSSAETINGYDDQNNIIYGQDGNDVINGSYDNSSSYPTNDQLYGGNGNDTLNGFYGNDTLDGGTGNDTFSGGAGNDTYVFGLGYGQDTVLASNINSSDVVSILSGVNPSDVILSRSGAAGSSTQYDLVLSIAGTSDKLTIQSYLSSSTGYTPLIQFANGTTWDATYVKAAVRTTTGTASAETINGYDDQNNIIYGQDGNDVINGSYTNSSSIATNDTLYGGNGNDTLNGYYGNDLLDGGAGNDTLSGGSGNDTYVFGLGYGQDTILASNINSSDTVSILSGVNPADVTLSRGGIAGSANQYDLILSINGTSDTLTIKSYLSSSTGYTPLIQFSDGTTWDTTYTKNAVRTLTGTATGETISGYDDQNNTIYGLDGNDTINGNYTSSSSYATNDTLYGGTGNDILNGNYGNDILDGGTGNDTLSGGAGNDTYVFGLGYGQDSVVASSVNSSDVVSLLSGVSPSDVVLSRGGPAGSATQYDLVLSIAGTSDTLTIKSYLNSSTGYTPLIQFANGTSWDAAYVKDAVRTTTGTSSADTMYGYDDQNNIIYGQDGNDIVYGSYTNSSSITTGDTLYGGNGNDTLYGYYGNDALVGGAGNDTLYGGVGNDTYTFNTGDGTDTIMDGDGASGNDKVVFANANPLNIIFAPVSSNLQITTYGTTDSVTINSWTTSSYKVENIQAADGSVISSSQLDQLVQAMATFSANHGGISWSNAVANNPTDVQAVLSQYWVTP
jgi:Ca2+-binding RTX toxin-like protein